MTKLFTHTEEIESCGQCPNAEDWFSDGNAQCGATKSGRLIKDMWGEIPKWCPLPEKEVK